MATYDLKYPGAAIDAILDTAYDLQNAGYIFRGLASEYSNTPTERSWVLAGEGETGHGFTSPVPKGYIGVCVFNGTSWTGKLLKCVSIDSAPTSGSTNAVSSGGAYASISQLATTVNEALDNLTFTDSTPSAFLGEYIREKVSTTAGGIERILTYFTILAATASKAGLLSAADKAKLDALWSSGYQFAGIATPSTTPISTTSKIFYIATEAGTYFNTVTVTQGINIIYKSGDTWSVAQVVGIDNEPTAGSDRLVKSGGVFGELALGAVYDVSAKNPTAGPNSNGKWESLSALLSDANLNTLIPTSVRKGGMSIKYVQSSDNKYIQARCMAQNFTTDVTQWQGVDDEPTLGSDNLVKSGGVAKYRVENPKLILYTKKYLSGETGQKTSAGNSNWSCSEFVELDKIFGNIISLSESPSYNASSPKAASFVAYDENYNPVYISNQDGHKSYYKDDLPSTAKYIAFSFYNKTDVIVNNYSVWDSLHEISDQISVLHKLISNFGISPFWVDNNIWQNRNASYSAIMLPVIAGTIIKVTANANRNTRIAFLNTYEPSNIIAGSTIDGEGNQNTLPNNTSTYLVPSTCTYIALMNTYGGIDCLPISLIIDGVEYMKPLSEIVNENMGRSIKNTSEIYQIKTELENLEVVPQLSIVAGTIYKGQVYPSNDCLCAPEYINVKGLKSISIIRATDISVRISEYDSGREYIKQSEYDFIDSFELDTETNYVRISALYALRGYSESNPITVDAFTEGDFGISYIGVNTDTSQTTIIDRNINKDASVRAVGKKAVSSDIKPLSFIHVSDIHTKGDNFRCFENACEFYEHYSNINFMIVTGDLVWDTYHDPTTWYDKALAKTSKPVLNVIGNHDAGQYNATYGLDSQSSDLECYNKFIAPYVNAGTLPNGVAVPGWGVIQPTNASTEGKSYYYKDFTDEKIRLIVLCEFETDYEINQDSTGLVYSREYRAMRQAQVTWLIDTLTNTPSDYGVIVAYHQPDALADEENEFVSFDLTAEYRAAHGAASTIANVYCDDKQWLPKILNAFATKSSLTLTVTQTGAVVTSSPILVCDCDFTNVQSEFICILNGHTHRDYIGHHFNYPALTVLCVGADNLRYTSSFQPRLEGTPSEDLFNVVNIDRNRKTIKIIRIGSDASVTGQVRDQMIMSYATT